MSSFFLFVFFSHSGSVAVTHCGVLLVSLLLYPLVSGSLLVLVHFVILLLGMDNFEKLLAGAHFVVSKFL